MEMRPETLQQFARQARTDARDYRERAAQASPYWRDRFLTSAAIREDDADFYERKARGLQ